MAVIHEKLTLDDYFSATFTKFLQYGEKAAGASQRAAQAASNYQSVLNSLDRRLISTNAQFASMMQEQQRMAAAGQQNTAAFADLDKRMEKLGGTIRDLTAQYDFVERQANEAAQAANKFASANKTAQTSSTGLSRSLKGLLGGYLSFQSVKSVFNLSDQLASTNARLQMMTGSAEAAAAAQDEIYAAAMRSLPAREERHCSPSFHPIPRACYRRVRDHDTIAVPHGRRSPRDGENPCHPASPAFVASAPSGSGSA